MAKSDLSILLKLLYDLNEGELNQVVKSAQDAANKKGIQLDLRTDAGKLASDVKKEIIKAQKAIDSKDLNATVKADVTQLDKIVDKANEVKQKLDQRFGNVLEGVTFSDGKIKEQIRDIEGLSKATVAYGGTVRDGSQAFQRYYADVKQANGGVETFAIYQNKADKSVRMTTLGIKEQGIATKELGATLEVAIGRVIRWSMASLLIYQPIKSIREAIGALKDIDTQLVSIQKVLQITREETRQYLTEAISLSQDYGRVLKDVLTTMTSFSRQGYSGDQLKNMAEASLLLQNIGYINADVADRMLISMDAAWKLNGNFEVLIDTINSLNNVTNKNPVTMKHFADSIMRAGSVAATAGLSMQDYSALIGVMVSKTQRQGQEMAVALRSVLMNVMQVKGNRFCPYVQKCA